jgi:hypothetical protein
MILIHYRVVAPQKFYSTSFKHYPNMSRLVKPGWFACGRLLNNELGGTLQLLLN